MCNPRPGRKRPALAKVQSDVYWGCRVRCMHEQKEIHLFSCWHGHSTKSTWTFPGMKKSLDVSSFLLPASPLGYRWRKEKKILPALQHFKWKVEECLVRNITFYFLTFIWCADPLVLCNTGDFSCSNCVINPLIKDWACQGSNSYQSAAVLQKIPVSLENTGKLQKGLNKIQP